VATGAKAVARIAEAAGILPATVSRAARTLREANPDLWPEAGKGGGKRAAHVEPSHLVNLVLALAAADPITRAPDAVRAYRSLTPQVSRDMIWSENLLLNSTSLSSTEMEIDRASPDARRSVTWLHGKTLGEGLEWLINLLSAPVPTNALSLLGASDAPSAGAFSEMFREADFSVALTVEQIPRATVHGHAPKTSEGVKSKTDIYSPPPKDDASRDSETMAAAEAPFERVTTIPFKLFKVLAELWADTLAQQPEALPSLSPSAPTPIDVKQENESAGTPAREPAPTRDKDRDHGPRSLASLDHKGEREISQPFRGRALVAPPPTRRVSRYGRPESDSAHVAAA